MPDPQFQSLFDDTDALNWASTGEVRDRARRRVRRTRMATVAAVVAAVGLASGSVAVAQRDRGANPHPGVSPSVAEPSPTPPSPTPSTPAPPITPASPRNTEPTAIVNSLFLQPSDIGSGYRVTGTEHASGDWTFEFNMSVTCDEADVADVADFPSTREERLLGRGIPGVYDGVIQSITRFQSGDAARYLDQVRDRVEACKPYTGKPFGGNSIKIVAQRFAGQDALLIEAKFNEGGISRRVMVRQGDLVTEFVVYPRHSHAALQEFGSKAAHRLCGGTPVC
jgi:hypothetical protein